MAKKKVIYFTAGPIPTTDEKAELALLNAAAETPYEIAVRNGLQPMASGGVSEACDYVAGTIPDNAFYEAKTVIDPDAIPNQSLSDTQAVVNNGDVLAEAGGGTVTVAIVDGVATYTYAAA